DVLDVQGGRVREGREGRIVEGQLADPRGAARLHDRGDRHGADRRGVRGRSGPPAEPRDRTVVPLGRETAGGRAGHDGQGSAEDARRRERMNGDMSKKWYVIHTYSGHENKVKTNLEKAIHSAGLEENFGQILVATEDFAEMKDGKRKISKRKTFPSYVMIEMELDNETRHLVQNVPGVTRFIGSGQSAVALKENEVRRILGQMEATKSKPVPTVSFRVGDHVR